MCGRPKAPPPPPPPPPMPSKSDAEIKSAEQDARKRRSAAKGRQSTILTTGQEDQGQASKKTLLGQ